MAMSEAQKEAKRRYRKKTVGLSVEMYPETDADIIKKLEDRAAAGEPKTTYVKRLIREDIARNRNRGTE